jgi:hypothetical protein
MFLVVFRVNFEGVFVMLFGGMFLFKGCPVWFLFSGSNFSRLQNLGAALGFFQGSVADP